MLSRKEILETLKKLSPYLNEEYGVSNIGLFGSFSIDKAEENSGIDLLVDYEQYKGWKTIHLGIYLKEIFGRKVDIVSKNALKDRIKNPMLKQVIPVG